jgi:type IV secretion system protein TrbE
LVHTATRGDPPNPHAKLFERGAAVAMAEDAAAAAARALQGTRFGFWTQNLLVFEPDAATADRRARELLKALTEAGVTARQETVNALDAWQGSLPGNGTSNLRAALLSLANLTHLVGLTDLWPGEPVSPNRMFPPDSPPVLFTSTGQSSPFRLHLHHGDVGHTLVLGPTGSGKSTLVALLVAGFLRYEASRIVVFDVGGSYELFALAAGVPHHKIGASEAPIRFQPLRRIDEPRERLWAVDWLELVFSLQGSPLNAEDRGALAHALELLASEPPPHRTLSVLEVHLPQPLKAALRPYTAAGSWGSILDASEDGIADARLQIFEIRHLLELGDSILLPTLLYIFHAVEALLTGPPALLVLEEAWLPLAKPAFRDTAIKWLRTLRKANASVVLVTQSLSELAALPEAQLLFESCPTRICLPNPGAASSPRPEPSTRA